MMPACDGTRRNNKWCRHINGLLLLGGRRRAMGDGTCRLVGSEGASPRWGCALQRGMSPTGQGIAFRETFCSAFMEMVATLDMQLPHTAAWRLQRHRYPCSHYSEGDGAECPLLARLLGPGGLFPDLQMVVSLNGSRPLFIPPMWT